MVLYSLQYIYWYFIYSQFLSKRTFKINSQAFIVTLFY